jgi:uncharacterized protein with PQ loop repeat
MANCEKIKYISTLSFIAAFSILVYRVYKTQDVKNLSYPWISLVVASQLLLMIYGICNKQIEVIVSSIYVLAGVSYIFAVKQKTEEENYDAENKRIIDELRNKDIL